MLPNKWCIKLTQENEAEVGGYYNKQTNRTCYDSYFVDSYLTSHNLHHKSNGGSITQENVGAIIDFIIGEPTKEYPEITLQQFRAITMTNKNILVNGPAVLKEAFVKELNTRGWKPYGGCTNELIQGGYNIKKKDNEIYIGDPRTATHTLPEDWNAALEHFPDLNVKYQKGDIVIATCITGNNPPSYYIGEFIRGEKKRYELKDWRPLNEIVGYRLNGGYFADIERKATAEEIKQYTFVEETVMVVCYMDSEDFPVKVGKGYIEAEGVRLSREDVAKIIPACNRCGSWGTVVNYIDIGCKVNVSVDSLRDVIKVYDKLNS